MYHVFAHPSPLDQEPLASKEKEYAEGMASYVSRMFLSYGRYLAGLTAWAEGNADAIKPAAIGTALRVGNILTAQQSELPVDHIPLHNLVMLLAMPYLDQSRVGGVRCIAPGPMDQLIRALHLVPQTNLLG